MYFYLCKYHLLSLIYNFACLHVFRVKHLVSDKQSTCFSLGKTIAPIFNVTLVACSSLWCRVEAAWVCVYCCLCLAEV